MSQEILIALQNVHDRMRERMQRHPEYCAMLALEKSIASISEILSPPEPLMEPETDQEIETAIAETIATKVAPISAHGAPAAPAPPPAPGPQRPSAAPFFPPHRVVGGQAMAGMR